VESNLGGGAVVTLRTPRSVMRDTARTHGAQPEEAGSLNERQRQARLAMADERQYGPSDIARRNGCSLATAYRDLERLERAGLVYYGGRGKRGISPEGKRFVERIVPPGREPSRLPPGGSCKAR